MKKQISKAKGFFALMLAVAVLLTAFGAVPAAAEGEADDEQFVPSGDRIIVSMGDSYSSGEGIPPFYGSEESKDLRVQNQDWLAHRSQNSWPGKLQLPGLSGQMSDYHDSKDHWFFVASSGAETKHIKKEKQRKDYNQGVKIESLFSSKGVWGTAYIDRQISVFSSDELSGKTVDYVTMTLGGNDADFGKIVETAATSFGRPNSLKDKLNSVWKKYYESDGIRENLLTVYDEIGKATNKKATILIAGYPQLFSGADHGTLINSAEAELINDNVKWFNQSIGNAVLESEMNGLKIHFVSVEDVFSQHGAYSSDPFLNEIRLIRDLEDLDRFGIASAYSIHPNEKGAEAYAKRMNSAIKYYDSLKAPAKPDPRYTQIKDPGERDVVLVLDNSGSMDGSPIENTREAAKSFVDSVAYSKANIAVVKYSDSASTVCDFTTDSDELKTAIDSISTGGSTNIDDGLTQAVDLLNYGSFNSSAKKIIVLMSDGAANRGREGSDLIKYAETLRSQGIYIYTLGFFDALDRSEKADCQFVMEHIANPGCHYEVTDAESLVFFFGDIADQINGQKYIYVRIACPVEVTVLHDGEKLDSSQRGFDRTSFGTLTYENTDTQSSSYDDLNGGSASSGDDVVKILRLKEGVDYDIRINGTGTGTMNYKINFMDEKGEYTDFREFENIRITPQTRIDTTAKISDSTVLNVDSDNDGTYDLTYVAKENSKATVSKRTPVQGSPIGVIFIIVASVSVLLIAAILVFKIRREKRG